MAIQVLDQNTINQIAAGEVVERPASVVKELMENAIDAGATAVTVEIKDGGIGFIRITDNGCGIPKEELPLAFLRHSTSKIRSAEDLITVSSLGFRGEALSSIAAVSQVELITKTASGLTGSRYQIEGGEEKGLEEVGAPDGTTFISRNLFFNTPARQKFLKTAATEGAHVADLVEKIALSHPEISIRLIVNNQNKLHTSGNHNLKDIIYTIYGREIAANLIPVHGENEMAQIDGFIGKPVIARGNRNFENYFINGRYIKSGLISKAIEDGYKSYMMQHKYPFTMLHFTVEPEYIDVNVHPSKMELRFKDGEMMYQMVCQAVSGALSRKELIPEVSFAAKDPEKKVQKLAAGIKIPEQKPEPFEKKRMAAMGLREERAPYGKEETKNGLPGAKDQGLKWETLNAEVSNSGVLNSGVLNCGVSKTENPEQKVSEPEVLKREVSQQRISEQEVSKSEISKTEILKLENQEQKAWESEVSKQGLPAHRISGTDTIKRGFSEQEISGSEVAKQEASERETPEQKVPKQEVSEQEPAKSEVSKAEVLKPENVTGESPKQMEMFDGRLLSEKARYHHRLIGQVFDTYWLVEYHENLYIIDQHAAHEKILFERTFASLKSREYTSQIISPPIILTLSMQEEELLKRHMAVFTEAGFEIEHFGGSEYAVRAVPDNLFSLAKKELLLEMLDGLTEDGAGAGSESVYNRIATMSCKAAVKGNNRLSDREANELIDQLLGLENPYTCPHGRPTIVSVSKYEMEKKFKRIV